jgi:Ca2+-binding EF-hand superfamily protein
VRFITEKTDIIVSSSGGGVSTAFDSNPDKPSALRGVDLTKLRDALVREQMECTDGTVSVARLNACLHRCVNPANRAPSTAVSALFNAVDVDDTGRVDVADVLITCAALCTSPDDPCARMKVAFDACDVDGDGSLTKDQAIKMLRGAVCSAACAFSLDGSRRFQNTETNDENADPNVRAKGLGGSDTVTLTMKGGYTMSAPRLRHMMGSDANKLAMRVDESMSVDVYVDVLVDDLFARHDTDWAGAVTWSDVGEYAGTSAFLRAWFGLDARVL